MRYTQRIQYSLRSRKQAVVANRERKWGDFTVDDLPEMIGNFELKVKDPNGGEYCAKHNESYIYKNGENKMLEISLRENYYTYEVSIRSLENGFAWSIDEEIGRYGYLGEAVDKAQERLE